MQVATNLISLTIPSVVLGDTVEEIPIVKAVSNATDYSYGPEKAIDRNYNTMYYAKNDPVTGIRGNFLLLSFARECKVGDVKIYSTQQTLSEQGSNIKNTHIYAIGSSGETHCGSIDGQ